MFLDLLPNDILFDFLLRLDFNSLINLLVTQKRFNDLYHARFGFFWIQRYFFKFKALIPDELALSYFDKFKFYTLLTNQKFAWNLVDNQLGLLVLFHISDKNNIYQLLADLYNQKMNGLYRRFKP